MTYAVSDLHGCLDLWNKIDFSDNDKMYVLGDVLDKGDKPMELLLQIMGTNNVRMINGNHELDFLENYKIAENNNRTLREIASYDNYIKNGGESTILQFVGYSKDIRKKIVNYLRNNRYYAEIICNNRNFVLTHGGISDFSSEKKLKDYSPEQLTLHRYKNNESFFEKKILVCGHTPNISSDFKSPAEIFISKDGQFYNIDCGCVFPEYGGRLAVLTLETLEVNYIT